MKAKIIKIDFTIDNLKTICEITFCDPYHSNVQRCVTGVALCNTDDTFDEVKGKRIAEGRAKEEMFKTLSNCAHNLMINKVSEFNILKGMFMLSKDVVSLCREIDINNYRAKREKKHLYKLIYG